MRCSCATVYYRDHADDTRDYKVKGKTSCGRCQGYGQVTTCTDCEGCGLVMGVKCGVCFGLGVVPIRKPTTWVRIAKKPQRA